MAKITDGTLRDWKNGDVVSSDAYEQDREILKVAVNDTDDKVEQAKTDLTTHAKRLDDLEYNVTGTVVPMTFKELGMKNLTFDEIKLGYIDYKMGAAINEAVGDFAKPITEELVATEGQTVFTLVNTYDVVNSPITVEIDGVPQDETSYTKTSTNSITLSEGVPAGAKVKVTIGISQLSNDNRFDAINTTLADHTKKLKGIVNIAEYDVVGDGVTDDLTPITTAVADAKLNGYAINWGWNGKTYLVTNTIPDFHKVKHIGNAIIKRGSNTFYINPIGLQYNNLYCSPTASSNTFDGLTPDKPVAKLQTAFDWMANYGNILGGVWQINLTAGTFVNRAVLKDGLLSENNIIIQGASVGGYPNVPTTIISEGAGAGAVGIFISGGSKVVVNDIKLTGFNGTSSSAGIKASNGAELTTNNVHADSCYWGISGENRSMVVIPDGIFSNCGYLNAGGGTGACIRTLQLTRQGIGIQNNGNQTNTCLFKNSYQALLCQESSTGHMDWCTIQDCVAGIVVRVNARVNCDGTKFLRNTKDISVDSNAHVYVSSNVVFGTGTDESSNKVVTSAGGNITNSTLITGKELAYTTIHKTFDTVYTNQTVATTSNTTVYTATLKAPLWNSVPGSTTPMKKLFFRIYGSLNGANSNKRITVRLGSANITCTYGATDNGTFEADGVIYFHSPNAQYMFMKTNRHLGTSSKQSRTFAANTMTSDVDLTIEAQVDNTLDNVVVEMIEIGLAG